MALAVALSLVAVAYNNLINQWTPFRGWAYLPANLTFVAALWAVAAGASDLSTRDLGLVSGDPTAVVGTVAVVAVFALGAFAIAGSRHGHRIADRRVAGRRGGSLIYYVLIRIPVGTAVAEEMIFRGVLFAVWREAGLSSTAAAVCSSIPFGLWHVSPTVIGLRMNRPAVTRANLGAAALAGVLLTTGAGLALTGLRVVGGGLLAPVLLHAGVNSAGAIAARIAHARRTDGPGPHDLE